MAQTKYRYLEDFIDLSTGRPEIYPDGLIDHVTHRVKKKSVINNELQSPRLVETRNFGKVLLHRIAKIEYETANDSGRKIVIEKIGKKGGWVESYQNLSQLGESWISDNAVVLGKALVSGDAQISGSAEVGDYARVMGDAVVTGQSCVKDNSCVYGDSEVTGGDRVAVCGSAMVNGDITGTASVGGAARVMSGASVTGNSRVGGRATVYGEVSGNAVVMGDAFVEGKVSEDAIVYGTAVIDKSSTVSGQAFVDGGNVFGSVSGNAKIGSSAMSYGSIRRLFSLDSSESETAKGTTSENDFIRFRNREWELVRQQLRQLWPLPSGLKGQFAGKVETVSDDEKNIAKKNGIDFSPVTYYTVEYGDRDQVLYVFSEIPKILYDLKGNLVGFLYTGTGEIMSACPIEVNGSLRCMAYGSALIHPDGKISDEEVEITGNSQIDGFVKGDFHVVEGNSFVGGSVKGMYVTLSGSLILGNIEGKDWRDVTVSNKSGSQVTDSFVGKEGTVYGNFNVSTFMNGGSLVMPLEYQTDFKIFAGSDGFLLKGESVTTRKYRYKGAKRYGAQEITEYLGQSAPSSRRRFYPTHDVEYGKIGDYYLDKYLNGQMSVAKTWIKNDDEAYEKELSDSRSRKR